MTRRETLALLFGAALLPAAIGAAYAKARKRDTTWLRKAKYGLFVHFLPGGRGWQNAVDAFDVNAFAEEAQQTGAGYVVFTLGQNNGFYCAPNAAYERYIGCRPNERCSKRDLPMELSAALGRRGIRLMLYLPSRAPQADPLAMQKLSDVNEQQPAPQEFTRKWNDVIREWSLRYKNRVSGWWFDGAYNTAGWDDLTRPYNWNTWAAACRAGNPGSLLAFNPGTDPHRAFGVLCSQQDYTAGEQNAWTATPKQFPSPPGVQWHVLSFLGSNWAQGDGPHELDAVLIEYVRRVSAEGGVVTCDVAVNEGRIFPPHLKQLNSVRAALRSHR